jgi:hypothetical protein
MSRDIISFAVPFLLEGRIFVRNGGRVLDDVGWGDRFGDEARQIIVEESISNAHKAPGDSEDLLDKVYEGTIIVTQKTYNFILEEDISEDEAKKVVDFILEAVTAYSNRARTWELIVNGVFNGRPVSNDDLSNVDDVLEETDQRLMDYVGSKEPDGTSSEAADAMKYSKKQIDNGGEQFNDPGLEATVFITSVVGAALAAGAPSGGASILVGELFTIPAELAYLGNEWNVIAEITDVYQTGADQILRGEFDKYEY